MAEFTSTKRGARCLHLNGFEYTLNKRGHNCNTDRGRRCCQWKQPAHPPSKSSADSCVKGHWQNERKSDHWSHSNTTSVSWHYEWNVYQPNNIWCYSECSNPALYEVFIVPKEKRTVASKACNNLWCVIWWWLGAVFDKRAVSCTEPRQHSCICNREELVSYSTFEIAPRLFHQVLTVHCFKHGKQFPLVYCLLPENSRLVYDKCFSIIGDKVNNLGFLPVVQRITTNFEFALIQAAEVQFPRATSKGCFFFHFSQAVWRRVQHLGLQ